MLYGVSACGLLLVAALIAYTTTEGPSMKLTNPVKSALSTALWSFIGAVAVLSAGWLSDLAKWASTSGHSPLPGLSVIGYALVSALIAASGGIVAFIVRFAQSKNVIPGKPPQFPGTA